MIRETVNKQSMKMINKSSWQQQAGLWRIIKQPEGWRMQGQGVLPGGGGGWLEFQPLPSLGMSILVHHGIGSISLASADSVPRRDSLGIYHTRESLSVH